VLFELGLMIGSASSKEAVAQAQWAEAHGFAGVWVGEGRLVSNAIVPMTLIAANTDRIKVGSGILPYRTRNVGLLAVTFKTLDDLAPGRMRMGLGPWWEPLASRTGLPNTKPLKAMREVIAVSRELLAGRSVTYEGEFVDVHDIRFDGPQDDDGHSYPVPIYIGAVRFGMVQLSGEIADGVLLDFLVPPSYVEDAVEAAARGAAISGRSMDTFEVPQLIAVSANNDDPQSAVDDCKAFLTQYMAQQSHITEFCGADPELIAAVKAIVGWPTTQASIREAMALVPDSLVRSVSACGTAADVLDKVGEYVAAGCTEAVLTPMGADGFRTLSQIADKASLVKV
jgi:5,10-methylenetetrahydromethanopterin reductase